TNGNLSGTFPGLFSGKLLVDFRRNRIIRDSGLLIVRGSGLLIIRRRRLGRHETNRCCTAGMTAKSNLEHDPEKWIPVFRKDHAQTKDRARWQFNQNPSRSGDLESQGQAYAIRTRPPTILCGVVSYVTTGRPGKCDSSNRP